MNSLSSFFTSPRGRRLVNLFFFLTAILGSSLLAIAACGLWLVYLAAALCQRPPRPMVIYYLLLAVLAVVIVAVNLAGLLG